MEYKYITTEEIPTYALSAIESSDFEGLTDEEEKQIKDFFSQFENGFICDYIGIDTPYFSKYPAFGLPTEVVDVNIYVL